MSKIERNAFDKFWIISGQEKIFKFLLHQKLVELILLNIFSAVCLIYKVNDKIFYGTSISPFVSEVTFKKNVLHSNSSKW